MIIRTSPLVQMTSEAKRPTRWWFAWIVAALTIVIGAPLGGTLGLKLLGSPDEADTIHQFSEIFTFGATLLLLFLWVRLKEGRRFSSIGFRGGHAATKLGVGFLVGAAMMGVGVLVGWATGVYDNGVSEHTRLGASSLVAIIPLVLVFVFQASTEEAATRGYMLQEGGAQTNAWVAILGSSVFFTVIHLTFTPLVLINTVMYAVFASFVALGQGNLWLIAGIHAGWNYAQGNLFGLPVSGNVLASSLFGFGPSSASNDAVSGGDYGLEASLLGTVVLAVALVVAFTAYRRAEARRVAETDVADVASSLP